LDRTARSVDECRSLGFCGSAGGIGLHRQLQRGGKFTVFVGLGLRLDFGFGFGPSEGLGCGRRCGGAGVRVLGVGRRHTRRDLLGGDVRDGLEHVAQSVALLEERCAVLLSDTTEGVEVVEDAEEIVSVCLC
jgi:hypothetical protein